jgi:hypothetical protein
MCQCTNSEFNPWELKMSDWKLIGMLDESDCNFSDYNNEIGAYKGEMNGELVYVGKATELNNGGYRKRLRDYTRVSNSARDYPAGLNMYKNRSKIVISIQIVSTADEAVSLERYLIKELKPKWNNQV